VIDDLSPEQRATLDAEIPALRRRLELRKAIKALPSMRERDADIDKLRLAVDRLRTHVASFIEGPAGFLSQETIDWLSGADAVAVELAQKVATPRAEALRRGMRRPNDYRQWFIGEQIPALYEKVFNGERLPLTVEGKSAKGRRGTEFVRLVLGKLDEPDIADETIKHVVSRARCGARVRASKTPTQL
jgi:hypothetical protein